MSKIFLLCYFMRSSSSFHGKLPERKLLIHTHTTSSHLWSHASRASKGLPLGTLGATPWPLSPPKHAQLSLSLPLIQEKRFSWWALLLHELAPPKLQACFAHLLVLAHKPTHAQLPSSTSFPLHLLHWSFHGKLGQISSNLPQIAHESSFSHGNPLP